MRVLAVGLVTYPSSGSGVHQTALESPVNPLTPLPHGLISSSLLIHKLCAPARVFYLRTSMTISARQEEQR